jgi:DNA-directed RNA polymerase subunit RPC12/RpoP
VKENLQDKRNVPESSKGIPTDCPHCGEKLSPWQQVLLSVDRVLTCKNCWYRIILSVQTEDQSDIDSELPEKE